MYAQHFGLTQDPFSIAPDPRYLFMSERHREALAHLLYGVGGGGGFVLLTGDIGAGKTTVCRCFLEQIPPQCHVAYIFNPKLTVPELLQSICDEFRLTVQPATHGAASVKDYIDALNAFLLQAHAQGHNNVLIIDEAQNLSADVLEQLRLLTNLETSERKLLQIVLIGQPELRTMLAQPELEQLAQRVIARFHLGALSEGETAQYIQHRLSVAGHRGALPFNAVALKRIWQQSRGVPRRINLLCDRALLGAWAHSQQQVSRQMVDQAAAEVFGAEHGKPAAAPRYAQLGWGLAAGALLTGALVWGWSPTQRLLAGSTTTPMPVSAPTASAALAASSVTATAAVPAGSAASAARPTVTVASAVPLAPTVIEHRELNASLLQQLPHEPSAAWRNLSHAWNLTLGSDDPCTEAARQRVQCFNAASGSISWPLLRQLGRPGWITLQSTGAAPVYAVLVGLADDSATLQIDQQLHRVPLLALSSLWRGDFSTYWQLPPGYVSAGEPLTTPTLQWLAARLSALDGVAAPMVTAGSAPPQIMDASLRARVQAFQRTQGLKPDGLPGPMTLMQLSRATHSDEPRLRTDAR